MMFLCADATIDADTNNFNDEDEMNVMIWDTSTIYLPIKLVARVYGIFSVTRTSKESARPRGFARTKNIGVSYESGSQEVCRRTLIGVNGDVIVF